MYKLFFIILCLLMVSQMQAEPIVLANSVAEFSGVQGQDNWYYGYVAPASSSAFKYMGNYNGSWYISSSYWTQLNSTGGHPNGISTSGGKVAVDHYAVRRWISETEGSITITGSLKKSNTAGGNGIVGRILVDGITVYSQFVAYNNGTGYNYTKTVNVSLGSTVDFVIDPYQSNDGADSTIFTAQIAGELPPVLTVDNTHFGNVRVGTSANASISVTNTGLAGSSLTGTIGAASGSEFSPTSGTESFSLGQNQSSSRTFTYTPNARGTDSTIVSVNSNASNTSRTLTGTGVSPVYSSSVAPDSAIDFGIVDKDQTVTRSLTIQNLTPDADLGNLTNMTLLSATISGEGASSYSLGGFTPGTVLSKGMSLNLLLSITNLDHLVRTRNATLTIVTDENAALGETGNVYTYQLVAYTVPEPSSCIFLTLAIVFFAFQGKKNFHRFLR